LAGAAAAFALAVEAGRRVLVLEREAMPGLHASGRNAAMVRRLVPGEALGRLAREGAAFIDDGAPGLDAPPAYRRSGGLLIGGADRLAELADAAAATREAGADVLALDAPALRARFPVLARSSAAGGLLVPRDGVVDVAGLLLGYLAAARRAGAEVAFDEPVEAIGVEAGRVAWVQTPRRRVDAPVVIDAAGAWAAEVAALAGALPVPIRPLRRHLFFALAPSQRAHVVAGARGAAETTVRSASAPPLFALQRAGEVAGAAGGASAPSVELGALGLGADAPWIWDESAGYYTRPEAGGLLLCACDESEVAPGVPTLDAGVEEALYAKLAREAPLLAELPIASRWAGLRAFAPDRLPLIGWDPRVEGFLWLAALGGHGVTVSAAAGRLAAAWIRGGAQPEHAAAFAPVRFG
jgi:D-arginine dehydrogenase